MDKVDKFTRKLRHNIAVRVLEELKNIRDGQVAHLDVRKLKGTGNLYRVRLGRVRIKFVRTASGNEVVDVGFRSENTY